MNLCQKCGAEVDEDAHFCDNCGMSLEEYPPAGKADEAEQPPERQGLSRGGRNTLIVFFVVFDLLLAVFILYYFSQYGS
jgi:uncharacterized membrane protein YvbJ